MRISLEQAATILARTQDEVLYFSAVEHKIKQHMVMDDDIVYNEDGTVSFTEGNRDPVWEFDLDDVLNLKQDMDNGLCGEIESILES
jgi:hypothetical protein